MNKTFFGKLPSIENGAIVELTDSKGLTVKYKVYDKYVVENPYEVLNYYEDLNLKKEKDRYDTTDIVEYLKGNKKIGVIKDAINEKNIDKFGKIDGNISVTFIVKNNKVLIKKIG